MDVKPTACSLSRFPLSYCPRRSVSSAKFVAPLTAEKNHGTCKNTKKREFKKRK